MSREARERARLNAQLQEENDRWPKHLVPIPESQWPEQGFQAHRVAVFRSRRFLVQVFAESNDVIRLSVNRTSLGMDGRFADRITWDELQELKKQAGFGDREAVEIFPRDAHLVNVANIRHLWVLPQPLEFSWRKSAT